MLKLFRTNTPFTAVFLFLYALALCLPSILLGNSYQAPIPEPFSKIFFYFFDFIANENTIIYPLAAFSVIYLQAILIKSITVKYKMLERPTFIPAILFVAVAAFMNDFVILCPVMLANFFIIFFLDKIFESLYHDKAFMIMYDCGLLAGIAAMFYYPAVLLLPLLFVGLIVIRPIIWREWFLSVAGFFTPLFLTATYYYWNDNLGEFLITYMPAVSGNIYDYPQPGLLNWVSVTLIGLFLIGGAFFIQMHYMKRSIQFRKFFTLVLWLLFLSFFSYLLKPNLAIQHFVIVTVPVSLVISYFFMNLRYRRLAEALHIVLFLLLVVINYRQVIF